MKEEEIKQAAKKYAKDQYGDYESTSLENRIKISTARKAFIAGYSLAKPESVKQICPETKVQCQGNKLQCNGYCWLQMGKQPIRQSEMEETVSLMKHMESVVYPAWGMSIVMTWFYSGKWHAGLRNCKIEKSTHEGNTHFEAVYNLYQFCFKNGFVNEWQAQQVKNQSLEGIAIVLSDLFDKAVDYGMDIYSSTYHNEERNTEYLDKEQWIKQALSSLPLPPAPVKDVPEKECEKWCGLNYCDENGCMNRVRVPAPPAPKDVPVQSEVEEAAKERPTIKQFFGENATLQEVANTYYSQPQLFNYAQALDRYIDEWQAQKENVKDVRSVEELQEQYIQLLIEELNETVGIANQHGWRSRRFLAGEKLRAQIHKAKLDENVKDVE